MQGSHGAVEPWEADRELDATRAEAAIAHAFPELRPLASLVHVGSGWDFDAFRVEAHASSEAHRGAWLFRFPRRREGQQTLACEMAVLPRIARALGSRGSPPLSSPLSVPLSLPLSLPHYEKSASPGPHFPYAFAGHRFLPGVAADAVPPHVLDRRALARGLGVTLARLHALPPEDVRREDGSPSASRDELVSRAPELRPRLPGDLAATAEPWLRGAVAPPEPYEGPPRLLHDDICPDHILVSPEDGAPRALIDWSDVAAGDPALDLANLYAWLGEPFVRELLEHYTAQDGGTQHAAGSSPTGLLERARFYARVQSLVWLADCHRQDPGVAPKHEAWVRTAFALAAPTASA